MIEEDCTSDMNTWPKSCDFAYSGLWYFDGSITVWELLCVEVVDNVCTRAYMQFYLI